VAVSTITSEPVAPSVSHASQTVQDAGKSGAVLKQQNKELSNQVHQSNQALDAAIKRAEYLSHAGSATKAQLDDALNFLKSEQTAKLEMQRQIDAMTATIEALNNQITDAGQALSEALEKAGKADQAQKTLVATATAQSDLAKANAKEAADWKTKYEAAAPYQRAAHIVYWVLGIYLVLLILKFVAPPPYSALFALVPVPKF
jgi:ABC-type transporter Mla subunit MlaD